MRPAGFWIRLLALIIDGILFALFKGALNFILMAMGLIREATEAEKQLLEEMAKNGATPAEILGASLHMVVQSGAIVGTSVHLLLSIIIAVSFVALKGGTPGKLALGLKIQESSTGKIPSWWRAFIREVVGKYFLWPLTLGIGALMTGFTEKKRGLHDIAAGTVVIKLTDE